jgi:Bacterial protein of unknown function (DUF885)
MKTRILSTAAALLAAALLLVVSGCQQATRVAPSVAPTRAAAWDDYVTALLESEFNANPPTAVWAGRHEFDGRLPDWSRSGIDNEVRRLHAQRERALQFNDGALDEGRRLERDHVVAMFDGTLFWLESAQSPFNDPSYYGGGLDPNVYVAREYAPLADRLRAYIKYAEAVPAAAAQIRQNLHTPMPRTYVQIGRITFGGLATFYEEEVPVIFSTVTDVKLQADLRRTNAGAIVAMRGLDAWLGTLEATATDRFALGPEKFSEMLRRTELVDVPLAQLKDAAERDLARNLGALRAACAAYAPGQSDESCIARMQADKPPNAAVAGAQAQLARLRAFVAENRLVTIPAPDQANVAEAPAYQRWNLAYIQIPGPYEKSLPATYYISPPDPSWSQADQDAYIPGKASLLFISVHEVWPGHFLQFLHSNRSKTRVGQIFISYAFNEGWAHYAEELMWEAGLGEGDAETHLGQLLWALIRDVRLLSAIGLHTGGMTVAESETLFREKAFMDPGNARQQAARGTFDPGYGNYTLGKLMIMKLRSDWTATRGGRSAWKDFHDKFLSYGAPPVPLVRRAMLGGGAGSLF